MRKVADEQIFHTLVRQFGDGVEPEWDVARKSEDSYDRRLVYAPRIDFAVGPFNTKAQTNETMRDEIHRTGDRNERLLANLKAHSDNGSRLLRRNPNPRCFLAIEVERETSRKHKLGGIVNASAIGLIGIVIAPDEKTYRSITRIRNYLEYLENVGKVERASTNVLTMTKDSFLRAMDSAEPLAT